jgi:hypothetical protein
MLQKLPRHAQTSTGSSEVSMADGKEKEKDWRELCMAVTNERDPSKLTLLVHELLEALDSGERSWRQSVRRPDAIAPNRESA